MTLFVVGSSLATPGSWPVISFTNMYRFPLLSRVILAGKMHDLHEDGRLLGCKAVQTGINLPTFQKSLLPPSWVTLIRICHLLVCSVVQAEVSFPTFQRFLLPPLWGRREAHTSLHGATTQKTAIFVLTAVRTSNRNWLMLQNFCKCL
jgi:hypothetical protein